MLDPQPAPSPASPPPWWRTGVVYQVYPRSFQDSNGDGIGDLPGITARLDHLVSLGIDALWISPFFRSPMKDFGYDVADYTDVDPIFGTLADFDRLVAAAHARGLKVIIDWVPNHTSDQHAWFQASRSSRQNPKRDWYTWRDPRPDGGPPNNWLSVFGGPAWTLDPRTGQYYLHSFLPEQPDLNWRNRHVRRAMLETLRFWLDRDVDGFRIDVAHYIMKDPLLRDNPLTEAGAYQFHKSMGEYDSQLHLYDRNHRDVHEVYREIRELLDAYSVSHPRTSVGEVHLFNLEKWAAFYGDDDELHMPFNFTLIREPWDAAGVRRVVEAIEAALPPGAWPNWVLGNHDEPRIATRLGPAASRSAMLLLLTLRGTPTLYYGDELGMVDVPIPEDQAVDPWGKRVPGRGLGRDPERTPMQWDQGPNAGFTAAGARPWLPLAPDAGRCNVAAQLEQPGSMLAQTRRLLALRRRRPALHQGSYRALEGTPEGVFGFVRAHGDDRVLVLVNFRDRPATVQVPPGTGPVVVSTHPDAAAPASGAPVQLRGNEGLVLELEA